jgi:hypothetical protein
MAFSGVQQTNIKRYSRWVLVLFVISWVNLVIQAPVHAGMKQQSVLSSHGAMANCHCPERLCDTVLNLENQSSEVIHFVLDTAPDFQIAYISSIFSPYQQGVTSLHVRQWMSVFEVIRPPPLDITRILLI